MAYTAKDIKTYKVDDRIYDKAKKVLGDKKYLGTIHREVTEAIASGATIIARSKEDIVIFEGQKGGGK